MTKRTTRVHFRGDGVPVAAPAAPAFAADIPRVAPIPVRPPVVAPRNNWYGFYIGGHGGYGWGSDGITFSGATVPAGTPTPVAADPRGCLGGITYGTN